MKRLTVCIMLVAIAACQRVPPQDAVLSALQAKAGRIRELVADRNHRLALIELDSLRATVGTLQAEGKLDETRAAEILAALQAIDVNLWLIAPAPTPMINQELPQEDRGKRDRKGRGNGGDGHDDD